MKCMLRSLSCKLQITPILVHQSEQILHLIDEDETGTGLLRAFQPFVQATHMGVKL
jgi:hypothetical protein